MNLTTRERFVILCLGGLLLLGTPITQAAEPPNILPIMSDDQGWGDVQAYGARDLKTPAIDALIADGVRMDNFYATCPVCSPTRAATLTGRSPDLVGVPGVIRTHAEDSWG